jgi:uncharacterized protein
MRESVSDQTATSPCALELFMDVTLVLTHRCNLDCNYCYAGEHHKQDIDDTVLYEGVELLFADPARRVQLSFFGGEPLLAFDAMRRAAERARLRAIDERRELTIQCTTNGSAIRDQHVEFFARTNTRVTVSIDGVAEAHDLNRPRAGGGSSFGQVHAGLRRLLDAGLDPDAMMVITPQTVPHVYRSVSWLWAEGVKTIRANLELAAPWGQQERDELSEQLTAIGVELTARRRRGQGTETPVRFVPFERGMAGRGASKLGREPRDRKQVVVGTRGHLYPCAPMVGEDRDDGPEAAMRLGHLDEGPRAAVCGVKKKGAGCSDGGACACASYLETGDRAKAGATGLWYAAVCRTIGEAIAAELSAGTDNLPGRRLFMIGVAAAASGVALAVPMWLSGEEKSGCPRPQPEPEIAPAGAVAPVPEPEPEVRPPRPDIAIDGDVGEPEPPPPGGISAPPPPEDPPETMVRGQIAVPVREMTLGELK